MKKSLETSIFGIRSRNRWEFLSASSRGVTPEPLGGLRDRLPVLVGAGQEEHVLAALAHVPGEDVGADRRVRMAEVGLGVHVVDRRGHVEGHGEETTARATSANATARARSRTIATQLTREPPPKQAHGAPACPRISAEPSVSANRSISAAAR